MAEYITKEQVIEWFRPYGHTDKGIPYFGLVTDIREMKAADVAPVVHGRWVLLDECYNEGVYCSACHKKVYKKCYANQKIKSKFCPHCGAKMDGGAGNGGDGT